MSKLDLNKPVQTVSGILVTLLKQDAKGTYPLIGVFENHKEQYPECWTAEGQYLPRDGTSLQDLVNVPLPTRRLKVWLIFNKSGGIYCYTQKPTPGLLGSIPIFGIKELEVEVTEGENYRE